MSDEADEAPKVDRRAIREAAKAPVLAKKNAEKERRRTLVKGKRKRPGGHPVGHTAKVTRARGDFVGKLLDRGATRQQAIDALMRPKSTDPSRPGGLGLTYSQAINVWHRARKRRGEEFQEEARQAREEQCLRLRGHISAAASGKQFGAVASLEREYGRVMGTDAPVRQAAPRGELRELIADAIADMSEKEILKLAGEDVPGGDEET